MANSFNVKMEMNRAAREFPQLIRQLPSLTRNAINKTATLAERESIVEEAKKMRLPSNILRNRYKLDGTLKEPRTVIRRATVNNLNTSLTVEMRGIPVFQIAGLQTRGPGGGVKGKGGRFYAGAFRVESGKHKGIVFARRTKERNPLMVPKIGVRERLTKQFDLRVTGRIGIPRFRAEYAMQLRRAAARYGVRA